MSRSKLVFAFVGSLAASLATLYVVVTYQPKTEADYELVVASPSSLSVLSSGKQPFVELRLAGDPIRYRIAVERFRDFDDPHGFLRAAQKPGAKLAFHIDRGARQAPELPRGDPKPTVFVESMAVGDRKFYPLAQRIAWHERNQMYARILAVIAPLLTLYLGRELRASKSTATSASRPG